MKKTQVTSTQVVPVDAEIKKKDSKRWNLKGIPAKLKEYFNRARYVGEDDQGEPIYYVIIRDFCPVLAAWLIENRNDKNFRKRSYNDGKKYAKDMNTGNWVLCSDPVTLSPNDMSVIDGQHRLKACADTGVPIHIGLAFGNFDDTVMNTGKTRSLSDLLNKKTEHNTEMAGALQQVWAHFTGTVHRNNVGTQGTRRLILDIMPSFKERTEYYIKCVKDAQYRGRIGSVAKVSGLFSIFSMIDMEKADELLSYMYRKNGVVVPEGIDKLVNLMVEGMAAPSHTGKKLGYRQLSAALISAWNHIYAGDNLLAPAKWKNVKQHYPAIQGMEGLVVRLAFCESDERCRTAILNMVADGYIYDSYAKVFHHIVDECDKNGGAVKIKHADIATSCGVDIDEVEKILDKFCDLGMFQMKYGDKSSWFYNYEQKQPAVS